MLHIALWEPEIPPNTGNIARLCAATPAELHLIGKLGFRLDDRSLRRAGLDYWPHVRVRRHATIDDFDRALPDVRVFCLTARAGTIYTRAAFRDGDCLMFGCELRGLPRALLERDPHRVLTIPMPAGKVRSLNLATAVGIVLFEALRQVHGW